MTKLKLGAIEDDKPVKLTIEFAGPVHRDLLAYAQAIGRETGQPGPDPVKVVPLMVERFMASDRAFARARKGKPRS
ncbi:MAG: DUF2274 domain-containing protein [Pseudorhodoplanes sp.]|uniref:DUF2274 domain-containing protein n=1 Tax=Pseudorhodoplanes sp. TaxID=1934341 RepID=UPI003D0D946B